jgi:hypothetical protein
MSTKKMRHANISTSCKWITYEMLSKYQPRKWPKLIYHNTGKQENIMDDILRVKWKNPEYKKHRPNNLCSSTNKRNKRRTCRGNSKTERHLLRAMLTKCKYMLLIATEERRRAFLLIWEKNYVIFLPTSHFPCDLTCGTLLSSGRTENKQAGNMALIRFILQVLPSLIRILYTMCVHILAHTWMPIHIHEALCIHL